MGCNEYPSFLIKWRKVGRRFQKCDEVSDSVAGFRNKGAKLFDYDDYDDDDDDDDDDDVMSIVKANFNEIWWIRRMHRNL